MYSSVSDVTWTKDANLLGTMISFSADDNNNGIKDVIEAIVAASTNNYYGQSYTVTASDFFAQGRTNFFGASAFISYLNSISYGDSTSWQLPTIVNFSIGDSNGTSAGNELSELYYQELGGTVNQSIPNTDNFDNEQAYAYWTGTETASNAGSPYLFYNRDGLGGLGGPAPTDYQLNVWAVTAGQVAVNNKLKSYPARGEPACGSLYHLNY